MTEDKETKKEKKAKSKISTMDITLVNSNGKKFTCQGACSNKEFKAICRAIERTKDQEIEVK